MVLEPGGGLSFPPPPGGGTTGTSGTLLGQARLFQRATPVFPFHLAGWPSHHAAVLGNVQNQMQQTMQAQHQAAAAAAVRFLSHHHPHHSSLTGHPLVPSISHQSGTSLIHHSNDHQDDDDDKKGTFIRVFFIHSIDKLSFNFNRVQVLNNFMHNKSVSSEKHRRLK